ncbi:MAG: NTP transferase domain-containing protein [archaeon]|nr:NTP transferase domain-containing protein [archaeon]
MEALINAGGKGSRMGACGIEKPMQIIGGVPVVQHVVDAMRTARHIHHVVVSVSPNTRETERYLKDNGIETIRTSGEDFMMDLHESFSVLRGDYVLTSPSDIPLLTSPVIDDVVTSFKPQMESMIVMIEAETVRSMGIVPSYSRDIDGKEWVISGISVMDRKAVLEGKYLNEECLLTKWRELAVNVNTPDELARARSMF